MTFNNQTKPAAPLIDAFSISTLTQDDWNKHAANHLKAQLVHQGISYDMLLKKLSEIGINETYKSLSAKINRGTFSFVFFMQCMKAIGQNTTRLD